jgi:transcriptional regulator with XRE-family HTH domain
VAGRDPSDEEAAIGSRLEKALAEAGITRYELAKHVGVARSTVTGWTQGRSQPDSLITLAAVCKRLGIRADWLIGLDDSHLPKRLTLEQARDLVANARAIVRAVRTLAPDAVLDDEPE